MDTRFSISNYPDARAVTEQLEALIKLPMHSIAPDVLKKYEEEYFDRYFFTTFLLSGSQYYAIYYISR